MVDIEAIYATFRLLSGASIDTRKIKAASMFFALKGPNFNGNAYAQEAFDKGAAYCVMDDKDYKIDNDRCIMVSDVLTTMQALATHHRQQLGIPVIAVAGSNGKTTTKELIGAVLNKRFKTYATEGNLNNHIGLPLSMLSLKPETEMAVLELGANHLNETERLCDIARPSHGLITNNGKDHLEGYGSIENVRKGNGELFDHLKRRGGIAFVSTLQKDLMEDAVGMKHYTYGDDAAEVKGRILEAAPNLVVAFKEKNGDKEYNIKTHLTGAYNFENIMAAVSVGLMFGVDETDIVKAIEGYKPSNNRSQWVKKGDNDFIVDCYNANPSSMQLAIENLAALNGDRKKMVVLGDMYELGSFSETEHRNIIALVEAKKIDNVVLIGPEFKKANSHQPVATKTFDNVGDAKTWFEKEKLSGYTILLKGSRGMTLEKLIV